MDQGNDDPNTDLTPEETHTRWFQAVMDWWKTVYDFYKHLMTIALGSIAAVVALVGGPFKSVFKPEQPQAAMVPKVLVVVSILAFAVAAAMSVQGIHSARQKMLRMREARYQNEAGLRELRDERVGDLLKVYPSQIWLIVHWAYLGGLFVFIIFLLIAIS
jgi:esterase/lipase